MPGWSPHVRQHLRRAGAMLKRGVLDLVYPACCVGCATRVPDASLPICALCLGRIERADAADVSEQLDRLGDTRQALDDVFALWMFDKEGILQHVQHALKYGNRPTYGHALGALVASAYVEAGIPTPDALVPIPLHRTRYLERGYNQSDMLAEGMSRPLGVPVRADVLTRVQATQSQTRLSRSARWANVQRAFHVATPTCIKGQSWLIVDDVLTTGATAMAAAHTLKEAGAASVHLATLAFARF